VAYNFDRLSDFDFESLMRDLLGAELGVRIEHFTRGRDRGIDLRYAPSADRTTIVQCKHYLGTGYAGLKHNIKTKEAPKVRALAPQRLILATSVPLTPDRKDDLLQLLSPHVLTPGDILGLTEIEALISKHPTVERTHFKLWLTSTGVLDRLVHSKVYNQTNFLRRDIEEHAKRYVQNDSFPKALDLLKKHRVCIVAGPPGIGKTTLAQMLMLQLSADGFVPVLISEDVSEGATVWNPEEKQFFYYDDFLGQTASHEKLGKNEDDRLATFLRGVNKTPNKVVVLTTREYILEQARSRYERLYRTEFDPWTCIVALSDYTKRHRAQILYNHLYFSDTPPEMLKALRDDGLYKRIIEHPKFNPRLVEFIATHARERCATAEEFPAYVMSVLDDPDHLWAHPFEQQLDDDCRALLLVLATLPILTPLACFYDALGAAESELSERRRLRQALRILDGDFVRTQRHGGLEVIGFANPSLRDFVVGRLQEDPQLCRRLLDRAIYFDQVSLLAGYSQGDAIKQERVAALRRTVGSEACVVETIQGPGKQIRGSVAAPIIESRLTTALEAGAGDDATWLDHQLRQLRDRWAQHRIGEGCDALLEVLAEKARPEVVHELVACLRDALIGGFESIDEARLWCWLVENHPDACAGYEERAGSEFYAFANAEVDALAQSENEDEIEGGRNDLKELADKFGCDFGAINMMAVDEQLDQLAQYADAHQDDWKERYHEERYEAAQDERFINDLFDGLADKDEG
jgi:hypothetical protein